MVTSIQISTRLQKTLTERKLFDKETYEEVIWNVIEDTKELSEQTKRDIVKARQEIKKGEFITLHDLKKKYKIQ